MKRAVNSLVRIGLLLTAGWMLVFPVDAEAVDGSSNDEGGEVRGDDEVWLAEPLRDPFWPVGFYPPDWDRVASGDEEIAVDTGDWEAARALLRISGTSRMGGRIAAIINGEIKTAGDTIDVTYGGTVYRWRVVNIDAAGRVQLQKKDMN